MPDPLRILIVDDEPLARTRIEHLLAKHEDVSIAGTAASGQTAIDLVQKETPDIVFLDMQMPRGSGLDVVRKIGPDLMPVTVFVTAHDKFAVQAFELAAADYLLKPYSDERFEEAFRRARDRVEAEDLGALRDQLKVVLQSGRAISGLEPGAPPYLKRIAVQSRGRMRIVPVDQIDHVIADGVYAELRVGRDTHVVRASLNTLEERLDPEHFFRVHRSAIVRLDEVEVLLREGGGRYLVRLKNGTELPVGRSRREELEKRLWRI